MRASLFPLPVVQNWDCQATGNCCREYRINVTDEERRRILAQGWDVDQDLGGLQPFVRSGWLRPRYFLNRHPETGCVFLNHDGRCRIHARHGYETKPLACRMFPFVLVPVADQWRLGMRFACPSVAASAGQPVSGHGALLEKLAADIADREKLQSAPGGELANPPRLDAGRRLDWTGLLSVADRFLALLGDRRDRLELRWRKCLALADLIRQTRLDKLTPEERQRTLDLLTSTAAGTGRDPYLIPPPTQLGRVIFRLVASLYTRKDHGPDRGLASRGRLALLGGVWRFARGVGAVPRMAQRLPEATFEQGEQTDLPLDDAADAVLERYYNVKFTSFQFCGPHAFGLSFREGIESLALTLPLILWLMRLYRDIPRREAAIRALTIIDDHFGYNPLLGSLRIRLGIQTLVRRGELTRLIAWYSR